MPTLTREQFLQSDVGVHVKSELQRMASSAAFNTLVSDDMGIGREGYTLTFVDRHINYLVKHPLIKPEVYLANLRVMTRTQR